MPAPPQLPATSTPTATTPAEGLTPAVIPTISRLEQEAELHPPLGRGLFGYRRRDVDAWIALTARKVVDLRHELVGCGDDIAGLNAQLTVARSRIRFHEDRETFVRQEFERVGAETERIIEDSRRRAAQVEDTAQDRATLAIDRANNEANQIIQHARDSARELLARTDEELARTRGRVDGMSALQLKLSRAVRLAMHRFEQGLGELEQTSPSSPAAIEAEVTAEVEGDVDSSARRTLTFGRDKAIAAATAGGSDEPGGDPDLLAEATALAEESFELLTSTSDD